MKKIIFVSGIFYIFSIGSSSVLSAAVVTEYLPINTDTLVNINMSGNPGIESINYGENDRLYVAGEQWTSWGAGRTLISFDASLIPSEAKNIRLKLYAYSGDTRSGYDSRIELYRVTNAWGEMTATWNNRPSFDNTQVYDQVIINHNMISGWHEWDITKLVNEWKKGLYNNNGLMLYNSPNYSGGGYRNFYSSENIDHASLVPVIAYDINSEKPIESEKYIGSKTYSNGSSYDISIDIENKKYCVFVGGQEGCSELYVTENNSINIKFYTSPYFNSSCKHNFSGNYSDGLISGTFFNPNCADTPNGTWSVEGELQNNTEVVSTSEEELENNIGNSYNQVKGVVYLPNVTVGIKNFDVEMINQENYLFKVTSAKERVSASKISNIFNSKTNILDLTNIKLGSEYYEVDMIHTGDLSFKLRNLKKQESKQVLFIRYSNLYFQNTTSQIQGKTLSKQEFATSIYESVDALSDYISLKSGTNTDFIINGLKEPLKDIVQSQCSNLDASMINLVIDISADIINNKKNPKFIWKQPDYLENLLKTIVQTGEVTQAYADSIMVNSKKLDTLKDVTTIVSKMLILSINTKAALATPPDFTGLAEQTIDEAANGINTAFQEYYYLEEVEDILSKYIVPYNYLRLYYYNGETNSGVASALGLSPSSTFKEIIDDISSKNGGNSTGFGSEIIGMLYNVFDKKNLEHDFKKVEIAINTFKSSFEGSLR